MKDNDELLRSQINALIKDEIQEDINDYVDKKEKEKDLEKKTGVGFVSKTLATDDEKELTVNISNLEVDKILREYKKIKKRQRSNLNQVKLLDKYGKPLK
tara:strand:- start:89 stop:388 length:300 start_codon:yes stop_codon:yes gene_type:complete